MTLNINESLTLNEVNKSGIIAILKSLFNLKKTRNLNDYDSVDEYYAEIGYDFESESLLQNMNLNGTSDLQNALIENKAPKQTNDQIEKSDLLHLLFSAFQAQDSYSLINFKEIYDFYELINAEKDDTNENSEQTSTEQLLKNELHVQNPIQLQNLLIRYNDKLNGYI